MGGLVHDSDAIAHLFPEDIMQESSVYQDIIAKGVQLGTKTTVIEEILEIRFQATESSIQSALEAIEAHNASKHYSVKP